jgi:hypothetical protein
MPLEVNEIGISMQVRDGNCSEPESCQAEPNQDEPRDSNREEIVEECVRRVLQVLKTLGGR